jgi:hypothetical protein
VVVRERDHAVHRKAVFADREDGLGDALFFVVGEILERFARSGASALRQAARVFADRGRGRPL